MFIRFLHSWELKIMKIKFASSQEIKQVRVVEMGYYMYYYINIKRCFRLGLHERNVAEITNFNF